MYNYQEEIIISYSRVLQFATTGRQARKIYVLKVSLMEKYYSIKKMQSVIKFKILT